MHPPYLTEKQIKSFFNNKFWNNDKSKYNFNKKFSSYYKLSYAGDIFVRTRKKIDEFRSSHWRYSVKKVFLEIPQNSQENTCASVSFLIKLLALGVTQVISCGFRKISKNNFSTEHLWTTASMSCIKFHKTRTSILFYLHFLFSSKDRLPDALKSFVVYKFNCSGCQYHYKTPLSNNNEWAFGNSQKVVQTETLIKKSNL